MKRVAILASGAGSNAKNIISHFRGSDHVQIVFVASNRQDAGVLDIAKSEGIECLVFTRSEFNESLSFLAELHKRRIDWIILAGFLWKVPEHIVHAFPNRIVNIHPSLLPKFGGKGMYGHHVHEAVYQSGEEKTGITIHFVNQHYDEGSIIFQASVSLTREDNPETIEAKVRALEHEHFPAVLSKLLGPEEDSEFS